MINFNKIKKNNSIGLRLLTGLILIIVFAALILYAKLIVFAIVALLILFIAAWEWSQFLNNPPLWKRWLYCFLMLILFSIANFRELIGWAFLILSIGIWIFAFYRLIGVAKNTITESLKPWQISLLGFFVLIPATLAILKILYGFPEGKIYLLILLLITCGSDCAAYFTGKLFGKTKLAPTISPNKTLAGFYGGLIFTLCLAVIVFLILFKVNNIIPLDIQTRCFIFPWFLLVFIAGVVGDLFESLLKRQANLKNSGNILPGHGGILDRLDSLLAAAPVFLLLGVGLHLFI